MLIHSLHVAHFRSIRRAELNCDALTVLLGRNGAGKSNFLRAIDLFYDVAAPVMPDDFFGRDTTKAIEIRITFDQLNSYEEEEFSTYVRDRTLTISKRVSWAEGRSVHKYFAAESQIPQFADIRAIPSKSERRSAWKRLVGDGDLPGLAGSPRSADEVEELMTGYERAHPNLLRFMEREEQFFGPRNVGGGKLDKFTKFVLVPAVREASEEIGGRTGAIAQILDTLVLRQLSTRDDVQEFRNDFETRARKLFGPATETELEAVAKSITKTLATFAPGAQLRLTWGEPSVPAIQPPATKVTLVEDDFEGDVERKGHGLQRALILTLLRELAFLSPEETRQDQEGVPPDSEPARVAALPDLILGIEEPELFLHPSRCRYLSRLLFELASPVEGGPRNQILYSTHSPHFVDLQRFDDIRVVRKLRAVPAGIAQTSVTDFSLAEAAEELARVCDVPPETFTRESFAARALPVMTHMVNEGFFADVALLVEGQSEVGALWMLQEILGKNWNQLGVAIIAVGGKESLDRPLVIFRGLSIPTYFVFDADRRRLGTTDEDKAKKGNRLCQQLANVAVVDFPETQVHGAWAVLEDNFESLLRSELGDAEYTRLVGKVAETLGYDKSDRVLKNIEGAARLVQEAYDSGASLPTLELIVDQVTRLAEQSSTDLGVSASAGSP
jgi:hypothetical protein